MLIINADDFGRSRRATDRILECHARHRITSTSAMVFMQDSLRAADEARQTSLDLGLHLNFSEAFSADSVPAPVHTAHERLRRHLRRHKYALILYYPWLRRDFAMSIAAQEQEFNRIYGRGPSHVDGHQHLHLSTNILVDRLLPAGAKVRRSFSFLPGEKNAVNRAYRRVVDRRLQQRHRVTDYFFDLPLDPASGRLARIADLARSSQVELMTHPERDTDHQFLLSDAFARSLAEVPLGTYAAL